MKKSKVALIILLGIVGLLSFILVPRKYEVPTFKEREGTKYWALKTGSKIGYTKIETAQPEKRNPIIYLHGGPGGKITDKIIDFLGPLSEQGHDLYFYDQIGSGHSDRLDDISQYSVKRHREDLEAIISQIEAEKVIFVGKSWGACLAMNFLQTYPEQVAKIILIGPGPILPMNRALMDEIPPDSLSLIKPAYSNKEGNERVYNWRTKMILRWAYIFNSKLASDKEMDDFFTYLNQELSKSTVCELKNYKQSSTGGGGYYSHIMTVKRLNEVEDGRAKLKKLDTPILILRGQCDNQQWGYTKEYLDVLVNSKLEILEGVGHDIISGKSEASYDLISRFLME